MTEKQFSIWQSKKQWHKKPSILFFISALLFLIAFWCFSLYSNITNILWWSAIDIFTNDLQTLSVYFLPVDKEVSQELNTLDKIVKSYLNWENIFKTKKIEIEEVRYYIINHREYLSSLGFERYDALMDFLSDLYNQREEVYDLLWENQSYNYLIPLQNGNEKRPNWWFFGSFAFVTISWWHIQDLEVIDSYLADYIAPTSRIDLPSWYTKSFWERQLWFVAWNKFWFTDMDWKNLKNLYEKSFNQDFEMSKVREMYSGKQRRLLHNKYIKWVIFLDSNLLVGLLPWFHEKMWEWQFVNASIDLIRGEVRSNKKEIYISEVLDYFFKNASTIAKNLINNWEYIIDKRYIQIYLSNISVSKEFQELLHSYDLNTMYEPNTIYAWDINIANNKSDDFLTKRLKLYWSDWSLIVSQQNDILSLKDLPTGEYQLVIDYYFFIPEQYRKYIKTLEEKYQIDITSREKWILVVNPVNFYDWNPERLWQNKWMFYYPWNMEILSVEWNVENVKYFQTDFSQGLNYTLRTTKTEDQLQAVINFRITK